jgi:hypothetical protein
MPDAATIQVTAIHTLPAIALKMPARRAAAIPAPERRHATAVPHASRPTSTAGNKIKANGPGESISYEGTCALYRSRFDESHVAERVRCCILIDGQS